MLSYEECSKYYLSTETSGTDYAKIQGLPTSNSWMLRSPFYTTGTYIYAGNGSYYDDYSKIDSWNVSSYCGIRPACWITL